MRIKIIKILDEYNIFKERLLRNIFFACLLIVAVFSLFYAFVVHPSFTKLLFEEQKEDSVNIARHLSSMFFPEKIELRKDSLPIRLINETVKNKNDFGLTKLKIFSKSGEIIFSTDDSEIGSINKENYFQRIVAKGEFYTHVVRKDNELHEGKIMLAGVGQTYVPIMKSDKFLGALEIYYDILVKKEQLDNLLLHSFALLSGLAGVFFLIIITVLIKENKAIREQKRAEQALRASEERFRALIENSTDLIVIIDDKGIFKYVNPSIKSVIGFSPSEILGKKAANFVHPFDVQLWEKPLELSIEKNRETISIDTIRIRQKDGSWIYMEGLLTALFNQPGINGILFNGRDITYRKLAEKEQLHREKLQGVLEMAGAVCHELNQPLQSISGYAELLLIKLPKNHPHYEKLMKIIDQVERIGLITEKLTKITKYETKNYLNDKIVDIEKAAV